MQEEYCTLDPITRKLTLTEPQRIAGVESDEYAKGLKFKFPKTVDDIDLTQMQLRINFMNSRGKKDQYIVTDLKPVEGEENYIIFTWPFSRLVTKYRGLTKFIVCAIKTDLDGTITTEWNTSLAQLRVLEGLEVDESDITPEEKDIIAQLIAICETAVAESAVSAQRAQAAAEQAAQGAQKAEAAATEADVSAQEAETSAVNSAVSAQQAQTAAEQAAQEAQQSETSATESAASAQQAQDEAEKVLDIIPVGGTKGQVLTKLSDEDKDYNWQDPTGGGSNSWQELYNLELTEDAKYVNKNNLNFTELEVYITIDKPVEDMSIYLTSMASETIFGDPRVNISLPTTYVGGNILLKFEVINQSMWKIASFKQNYQNSNSPNEGHKEYIVSQILGAPFNKPKIEGFTLICEKLFKAGTKIYVRGR